MARSDIRQLFRYPECRGHGSGPWPPTDQSPYEPASAGFVVSGPLEIGLGAGEGRENSNSTPYAAVCFAGMESNGIGCTSHDAQVGPSALQSAIGMQSEAVMT